MPATVPAQLLPARTPTELLTLAHRGLADAEAQQSPGLRYAAAHLAALRAAAAVLAANATPSRRTSHTVGVWALLPQVAPDLTDWALHFVATSTKRAACEAGIPRVVTADDADGMLRSAEQFVAVAETAVAR